MNSAGNSRLVVSAFSAALVLWLAPLCAMTAEREIVDRVERSFAINGRPTVFVRNVDGRTRITATNGGQVVVRATKEVGGARSRQTAKEAADDVEIRMNQVGNRIEIEAVHPRRWGLFWSNPDVEINFEIVAPRSADINAHAVDGPLEVEGFTGELELSSVDGDVNARNCEGRIRAKSVDGSIRLERTRGEIQAETIDGDVLVDGELHGVEVKSTDGEIRVSASAGSAMRAGWALRSTDGSIQLALPDGFSADLDAHAEDGTVRSDHPITMNGSVRRGRLAGKINGGGHLLRMESSDGDISITRVVAR